MSLDFNTLEPTKPIFGSSTATDQTAKSPDSVRNLVLSASLLASLVGLSFSLYTLRNVPKPESVSILCDPGLQEKLENEVKILQEIAESTKK